MATKKTAKNNKEVISLARKQGKRDGKNQVPRQDWGHNSVPFLIQLQRNYAAQGRELDLELEQLKLSRESQKIGALKAQIQEKGRSSAMEKNLERAEADLERLQGQLDGGAEEVPMAKFARVRMIGNGFYLPFLFLLFIGEYFITVPAFKFLMGEHSGTADLITLAASGLSVGVAHILGIIFKSKFDRTRPKSSLFNIFFTGVAMFVAILIVYLSNVRARYSLNSAGNLTGLSATGKLYYLWAFYSALQFTFVLVGIAISFMHYSEIESALHKAKRKVWMLRRMQTRRDAAKFASGASLEEHDIDTSKLLDLELEVLESKKILLRAQYEEAVAVYRDSNIHSRRDEMNGAHPSLQPMELDFRNSEFEISPSDFARI
jgi:hypothetical protein